MATSCDLEKTLLRILDDAPIKSTLDFAAHQHVDHQAVVGVCKSLETLGYVVLKKNNFSRTHPTPSGEGVLKNGSPEFRLVQLCVLNDPTDMQTLKSKLGKEFGPAIKAAFANKWITKGKQVTRVVENPDDQVAVLLQGLVKSNGDVEAAQIDPKIVKKVLVKRKLAKVVVTNYFEVQKGPDFALERITLHGDLTPELLKDGKWKTAKFRPLNLKTFGREMDGGFLHPLMRVRTEFRKMLLQMGFEEMPTNQVGHLCWLRAELIPPCPRPRRLCLCYFSTSTHAN